MEAVANPAASTPAKPVSVDSLNDSQRSEWLKTGELPKPTTEESAPSQDQQQTSGAESGNLPAKEAEAAADSEPAKSQEQKPGERTPQNAETRKAQLAKDIDELLEKRRKLYEETRDLEEKRAGKKSDEKQESSPVKSAADKFNAKEWVENWQKDHPEAEYEEAMAALADYRAERRFEAYKAEQAESAQRAEIEKANREIEERVAKQVEAAKKKYPDFEAKLKETNILRTLQKDMPAVDGFILDSDVGMEIMYHIATTEGEYDRLNALNPFKQARELVKIESSFSSPEKKAAPVRKITAVPDPPATVGGQNNASGDEMVEAIKNRDVEAYMRIANARDLAKK